MSSIEKIKVFIQEARVTAVYTKQKTVDILWIGMEGTRRNVRVINDSGNDSMPSVGDRGLVIGHGFYFYYIGKVEANYSAKINGTWVDPNTGKPRTVKEVEDGEVFITNLKSLIKTWLDLDNQGNMSLMNAFMEGFTYISNTRWSQVIGKTASILGNGINFAVGTALRNVPGKGYQPVAGDSGGVALEALLQIAYRGAQSVRFHLGEITDLVSGLTPELSVWGKRLKAILEVTAGVAPLGSIKIDEAGNIEVKSTTGDVHVDATVGNVEVQALQSIKLSVPTTLVPLGLVKVDVTGTVTIQSPLGRLKITPAGVVSLEAGTSLILGNPILAEPAILGATLVSVLTPFLTACYNSNGTPLTSPGDAVTYCNAVISAAGTLIAALPTFLSFQVLVGRIPAPPML